MYTKHEVLTMKKVLMLVLFLFLVALFIAPKGDAVTSGSTNNTGSKAVSGSKTVSQVKASHILVKTKEEAQELKTRIEKGEKFEDLAAKYSECPSGAQGGDLGYFGKGQMVAPFEKAAFEAPVGTVTDPVQTQFGWHLIKVTDKK